MHKSKKLEDIFRMNAQFEKETPYNFCDRWCERCLHERQIRCTLYKDELERRMSCIAHGRDEDDLEITEAVMEAQYKEIDEELNEYINDDGLDEEYAVDLKGLPEGIQRHILFVKDNPLDITAKNYHDKAHAFLKSTFYRSEKIDPGLKNDFEKVSWYHTLLPAKLNRALAGFHEPMVEGDISLCDAVAQLQVCKKAIRSSAVSLRNIAAVKGYLRRSIKPLLALLQNMLSRIELMESEI